MELKVVALALVLSLTVSAQLQGLEPNFTTTSNLSIYNPTSQSFTPNGPWSLMSAIPLSPTTALLSISGDGYPRIRQAFWNMADLVALAGGDVESCVRLSIYVSDMYRWRPVVNRVTEELWQPNGTIDMNKYCPRTIVEVQRLNDDDIVEVEGTFWIGTIWDVVICNKAQLATTTGDLRQQRDRQQIIVAWYQVLLFQNYLANVGYHEFGRLDQNLTQCGVLDGGGRRWVAYTR
ncbi:hypothetical protein LTR51_008655 [Lithohypha guttulata]|nr:hypothetical protein LTR51_008655 [Lithohypha guttulata]